MADNESTLRLHRFAYSPVGTFGSLTLASDADVMYTVERPWLENNRRISCIPEGLYRCRSRMFNRGGYETFEITDVPGRSEILFHVANVSSDVNGCVGLGSYLGCVNGQWGVMSSREAFSRFMAYVGRMDSFLLELSGASPENAKSLYWTGAIDDVGLGLHSGPDR